MTTEMTVELMRSREKMALIKLRSQCPMRLIAADFTCGCKISLTQRKPAIMQRRLSAFSSDTFRRILDPLSSAISHSHSLQFMLSQGCVREFQMQIDN